MSANMRTADRATSVVLAALGIGMAVGGFTMDRLEIRQIHPASIPGLVPMILGVLMVICAALLFASSRGGAERLDAPFMADGSTRNIGLTLALTLFYALVLVGWLPFFWATALFISAFALVFHWPAEGGGAARLRATAICVALGVLSSWAISALFSEGFLVRLP